ncbi:hypothetical protein Vretifemale_13800 [Volvox reticuliferus]|uniref:Uncharacterized protein n=1 Tax=Volvox reticuliferus TaxID=1737510 RepID=A0A8J4CNM1_9CHLO|nr:hypothetical protein Vretifemale_13800 [Volvox reticuliferus]
MTSIDDFQTNDWASPTSPLKMGNNHNAFQRQLWPDIMRALSRRDLQADAVQHHIHLAQDAASLLLQAVKRLRMPSAPHASAFASSEQSAALPSQAHTDGDNQASIRADVAWAARHALGAHGANCCQHLSVYADWACAWMDVQLKLVRAISILTIGTAGRSPGEVTVSGPLLPPLLPLWSSLKGLSGLHSPSPEVQMSAVQLLQEAILAVNATSTSAVDTLMELGPVDAALLTHAVAEPNAGLQGAAAGELLGRPFEGDDMKTDVAVPVAAGGGAGGSGGGSGSADVSAWTVCREFACNLAATDNDPRVVAAALRAAAALLLLCRDQCNAREWRQLAESVLTAAGRAKCGEVWSAAEAFTKQHYSHPGWRAAHRNLWATLCAAAAEPEGPLLGAAAAVNLCTIAATAAALEAAAAAVAGTAAATSPLLQDGTSAEVDGNVAAEAKAGAAAKVGAGFEVMNVMVSLAACISDAARHGGRVSEPMAVVGSELPSANLNPSGSGSDSFELVADRQRQQHLGMQWWAFRGVVAVATASQSGDGGTGSGNTATAAASPHAAAAAGSYAWTVPAEAAAAEEASAAAEEVKEECLSAEQACALAAAAQAACCSLGCLLTRTGALEVLEALVSRAEGAPLALSHGSQREDCSTGQGSDQKQEQLRSKPGGKLAVSRAGLLAAAAAVAFGAVRKLSLGFGSQAVAAAASVANAASATASISGQDKPPAAGRGGVMGALGVGTEEGTTVSQMETAVRGAKLLRRIAALVQDPEKLLFSEVGGAPASPTEPAVAAAARHHDMAVGAGLRILQILLLAALPAPLVVASVVAEYGGDGSGGDDGTRSEAGGGLDAGGAAKGPATSASSRSGIPHHGGEGGGGGGGGQGEANLGTAGDAPSYSQSGSRRRPNVIIEELPDSISSSSSDGNGDTGSSLEHARRVAGEWRQQQQALVPELVLLCATYAPVGPAAQPSAATVSVAMAADSGLPPPPADVFTPWAGVSGGVGTAAEELLAVLHRRVHPQPAPSRALRNTAAAAAAGAASLTLMPLQLVSEQDTLAACLPVLLRQCIRPIVVQRHVQSLEEGPIRPYTGPDTFTRAVAARRLAWLMMRSRHPFVGEALKISLPAVLACCDDPAPGVVQYGVAALHAAAVECLAAGGLGRLRVCGGVAEDPEG